ncbi:MAG: hypothetical protein RLZZ399_1958 [Verrucomicrobiota bacterium]|jgi:hypothetical protein
MNQHRHPYQQLAPKAFWRNSVAGIDFREVDPVGSFSLKLSPDSKVATAGSCFAQHISRHLQKAGFCYYVVEDGHPILPEKVRTAHQYGVFSCRYGNIYTAKQLLQLFHRAYGRFHPAEDFWDSGNGVVLDPFRPGVQPGGFASVGEMRADRFQHLAAVRRMFESLDVFVFTLGLTECWQSKRDGAVFPLCPGVKGGIFDASEHIFLNQDASDVVEDMSAFIHELHAVNPGAKVVLTVSPVPLVATAEPDAHALCATTYSKSVLRVAAETLRKAFPHVHYFPSYEIISGTYSRGRYFAEDLRSVTEEGVNHVMRLFIQHATGLSVQSPSAVTLKPVESEQSSSILKAQKLVDVECDEEALDKN